MNIYKLGLKKSVQKNIYQNNHHFPIIFRSIQASGPAMDKLIPPPKGCEPLNFRVGCGGV